MAGAAPGSRVVVEYGMSMLATHAPDGTVTRVALHRDDEGRLYLFNHSEQRPGGPETAPRDPEMLLRQATAAQKLGIEGGIRAKAHSLTQRDSETLMRMGYNARLDRNLLTEMAGGAGRFASLAPFPSGFRQARFVSDLLRTADGRAWLFAHPHTGTLYFNPQHSSGSMKQLRAYLRGGEGGGTP